MILDDMETLLNYFFTDSGIAQKLCRGPLSTHLQSYARRLCEQGYALQTGRVQLRLLGHFNHWLERKGISTEEVDPSAVERYLRSRYRKWKPRRDDAVTLYRLLDMINPKRADEPVLSPTSNETTLREFQRYLEQERGLSAASVANYLPFVRKFLSERFPTGNLDLQQLKARDITGFVQRQAHKLGAKQVQLLVSALRSFLRHLLHRGAIETDLAACVPSVASWSLCSVPKFLPPDQVQKVLDSCDRNNPAGKRDYAILLLLARLGLRASEIVALTLDDIDWQAGLITVCGKGKRSALLPLPTEVGEAIAEYLRQARPRCSCRRLFIRQKAPLVGFANSVAICSLVDRALERADVESAFRGSHLFRHSLATQMLNRGASLSEIGELLRHRRPDTTTLYAKVDLVSLRKIALPWPGGER